MNMLNPSLVAGTSWKWIVLLTFPICGWVVPQNVGKTAHLHTVPIPSSSYQHITLIISIKAIYQEVRKAMTNSLWLSTAVQSDVKPSKYMK